MKGIGGEGSARSLCPYGHIRPKPIPYFSLHVRTLASGLDWSYSAINKYSVQPRSALLLQLVSSRPRSISAQILHSGRGKGGSADKKFSSCFLNSYIIQTHFRMKQEEPPAPVARQEGSQTEVICFRSYQSHSLETGNGFALSPSLPPLSLLSRHLRLAEEPTTQQGQISPSLRNLQFFQIYARFRRYFV